MDRTIARNGINLFDGFVCFRLVTLGGRGGLRSLLLVGRARRDERGVARVESGSLQQPLAGSVFAVVDERAVPGEFPRTPPADAQQHPGHPELVDQANRRETDGDAEGQAEQAGVLRALLDGNPRHEDRGHDEPEQDPFHPQLVLAVIAQFQQKERQAPDQRHDQHGADGDDDIVGQRFLFTSLFGMAYRRGNVSMHELGRADVGHRLLVVDPPHVDSFCHQPPHAGRGLFVVLIRDENHGDRIAAPFEASQRDGRLCGNRGKNGDDGGVARQAARRLDRQLGKRQTFGQFQPRQGLEDPHELFGPAARFDDDGPQPVAVIFHLRRVEGQRARPELMPEPFLQNAIGRVAPVGDQPDLLAHLIDRVGQRGRRRDGQLRTARLAARR